MDMEITVQELNEVILTQYRDIERLQNQHEQLLNRMANDDNDAAATPNATDELPPHY